MKDTLDGLTEEGLAQAIYEQAMPSMSAKNPCWAGGMISASWSGW
jgi:hypothetical protein